MTTPKQPNDERQQSNGVTERIAQSPIQPRPIPRPGVAAENEQSGGGQQGGNPSGAPAGGQPQDQREQGEFGPAIPAQGAQAANGPAGGPGPQPGPGPQSGPAPQGGQPPQGGQAPEQAPGGGPKSPYQDGWSQLPQREPQTNLERPGYAPVPGRSQPTSPSIGLGGGATNARTTADLAAKAARKEAAMVKSVGLDGPTRSIARPELVKDMPDLSELRHPLPQENPTRAQAPVSPSAVQAVAGGEVLRATVQIRRIDPWSTLKISLVISVAMFFVWMLAVGLLYIVLEGMGVWERLNNTFTDMVSQDSGSMGLIDAGTVFGYAGVIGLINVVLFTALATVGTFIYNQCCDMVGGVQVTLADPD
ncbi:DUF3566 domain-containing protein [Nocardia brevicatena]|uniref:DUF3566 domain-containing protein n=1 Tax=Nocardia brevicatena TaxID=37327 RepID=UPI0002D569C0|nr:DUF3566 domain-containing protein [Nocardia brevicatena]